MQVNCSTINSVNFLCFSIALNVSQKPPNTTKVNECILINNKLFPHNKHEFILGTHGDT